MSPVFRLQPGYYLQWRQAAQRAGFNPSVLRLVQAYWADLRENPAEAFDAADTREPLHVFETNVLMWFEAREVDDAIEIACIFVMPPADAGLERIIDIPRPD